MAGRRVRAALTALAIVLTSGRPLFYHGARVGREGRLFRMYKFRTLKPDAEDRLGPYLGEELTRRTEEEVTRIGRALRKVHLDEVPQLWNVLRGEMSLIGPRPSPFRENQICVPWRLARLSVRPGITGLWQICRKNRDGGDFHQWIAYDLLYAKHVSAWLDLKILVATVLTLGGRWSVPLEWMISEKRKNRARRGAAASSDVVSYPFSRDALAS